MEENRTRQPARYIFGLWAVCAAAVILAVLYLAPGRDDGPRPQPEPQAHAPGVSDDYRAAEVPEQPPDKLTGRIDYALLQALLLSGYGPESLDMRDGAEGSRTVRLNLPDGAERFLSEFGTALEKWAPEARLSPDGPSSWNISAAGRITHRITISEKSAGIAPESGAGRLAVVIDDLGRDVNFARELVALDVPITFSILPGESASAEIGAMAERAGREVILHQPMQPVDYPAVNPGPGAMLLNMDPMEIRSLLAENLSLLPMAKGVNNHTGSLFTQDAEAMDPVIRELRGRGLFFLDSLTTNKSAASAVAKKYGLTYYSRSIFLDNTREVEAILRQIKRAEHMAEVSNQAIAIGHPYPETLAALKAWRAQDGPKTPVVAVSELAPMN